MANNPLGIFDSDERSSEFEEMDMKKGNSKWRVDRGCDLGARLIVIVII